jgi:hypothetical protein
MSQNHSAESLGFAYVFGGRVLKPDPAGSTLAPRAQASHASTPD